jgi:hypothetical protein
MPANELLTSVCASANKNAGIKFPINPTISKDRIYLRLNFFSLTASNGNSTNEATNIRMAPTCITENDSKPFFIKMKDAPQTKAKKIKSAHCKNFLFKSKNPMLKNIACEDIIFYRFKRIYL